MVDLETVGLIFGFFAGCYFIGQAAFSYFAAGEFVKLAVLTGGLIGFGALLFMASRTWRIVAILAFASIGPFFQHLLS